MNFLLLNTKIKVDGKRPCVRDVTRSVFVMGSMLGQNRFIAKYVKSCTYCCYVRCATLVILVGGMP